MIINKNLSTDYGAQKVLKNAETDSKNDQLHWA